MEHWITHHKRRFLVQELDVGRGVFDVNLTEVPKNTKVEETNNIINRYIGHITVIEKRFSLWSVKKQITLYAETKLEAIRLLVGLYIS